MKRCLLTYEPLKKGEHLYSAAGLKKLSRKLTRLDLFPYSAEQQRREAQRLAAKMSIQGIQPKLSVILNEKTEAFEIVEAGGRYIVKPQVTDYPELPENEDLTMHLAELAGFDVPWHGLIASEDGRRSYVVRRFDRGPRKTRIPQEDFAQLIGATRSTKYLATTERVAQVIEEFCTFPSIEGLKFYRLLLFSFLTGNEDLHIKNLSLTDDGRATRLTPVYDLVNTTIALAAPEEELALELNGKKRDFTVDDFVKHLAVETLAIPEKKALSELRSLIKLLPEFQHLVEKSFLSDEMKQNYRLLLNQRAARIRV